MTAMTAMTRDWTTLLTDDEKAFLTLMKIDFNAHTESYLSDQLAIYRARGVDLLVKQALSLPPATQFALLTQINKLVTDAVTTQAQAQLAPVQTAQPAQI